jgi:hypothetical protein
VELQPTPQERSDDLRRRLGELVRERQTLREREASGFVLEQNRLEIVQTQLELSRALVSEHSPARVA